MFRIASSVMSLLISTLPYIGSSNTNARTLEGIKIVMVIAPTNYRDEELLIPFNYFYSRGADVSIVSRETGTLVGMLGAKVVVDKTLDDVNVTNVDVLFFSGGTGSVVYQNDKKVHMLIKKVYERPKTILASICLAPVIFAKAGILKGKKATVWIGAKDELKKYGAVYTGKPVERDGRILTGDGPTSAFRLAVAVEKAVLEVKKGRSARKPPMPKPIEKPIGTGAKKK